MRQESRIRAARALARIDQAELAARSGLSLETIKRLERIRGAVGANLRTFKAIQRAFEELGVAFENADCGAVGVRMVVAEVAAASPARAPRSGEEVSQLHRLIYYSRIAPAAEANLGKAVHEIVETASRRNAELNITGALLTCGGYFLQVLEGNRDAVLRVYGGIALDSRHSDLRIIESRPTGQRRFSEWNLCCGDWESCSGEIDANHPGLLNEPSMADGFRPETLSPAAALGLLAIIPDLHKKP